MYILNVVPIGRGIHTETLTYFSAPYVAPGSLVHVMYGRRKLVALVMRTSDVKDLKTDIKRIYYQLKNILDVVDSFVLSETAIRAAASLSDHYHIPLFNVLSHVVPKTYLAFLEDHTASKSPQPTKQNSGQVSRWYEEVLQISYLDRRDTYKRLVREHFSQKESLVICVPTIARANDIADRIAKGVEDRIVVLHSGFSKKALHEMFAKIHESTSHLVVITTPAYACVASVTQPQRYVLEQISSPHYTTVAAPHCSMAHYLRELARASHAPCILADSLLPFDVLYAAGQKSLEPFVPLSFRIHTDAEIKLFERKTDEGLDEKKPKEKMWQLFVPKLVEYIQNLLADNQPLMFFVPRKGYASITVCNDCNTIMSCEKCSAPLIVHKKETTYFACHHCKTQSHVTDLCPQCGGHRLQLLGITIERVAEELQKLFPETPQYLIDASHTSTPKQVRETIKKWRTSGGCLISTNLSLSHITEVPHIIVPSLASLLARPNFDTEERVMRFLVELIEKAETSFALQTNESSESLARGLRRKNITEFVEQEFQLREQFKYPPFVKIIHIHFPDAELENIKSALSERSQKIAHYEPRIENRKKKTDRLPIGIFLTVKIPLPDWREYTKKREDSIFRLFLESLGNSFVLYEG